MEETSTVAWEPGYTGPIGRTRWPARLEPLKARPGMWAHVWTAANYARAHVTASNLRTGLLKTPPGRFEFAVDQLRVLARYLGPGPGGEG